MRHERPGGIEDIDLRSLDSFGETGMKCRPLLSQFEHVAQYRNAASALSRCGVGKELDCARRDSPAQINEAKKA